MTTTLSPPAPDFLSQAAPRRRGGQTLEDRLAQAWEGLNADGAAACPVCHGRMDRQGAAGHCSGCGSTLD
jgi:hypothetical protein